MGIFYTKRHKNTHCDASANGPYRMLIFQCLFNSQWKAGCFIFWQATADFPDNSAKENHPGSYKRPPYPERQADPL